MEPVVCVAAATAPGIHTDWAQRRRSITEPTYNNAQGHGDDSRNAPINRLPSAHRPAQK
jgi:hypothetical protein